jgi:hypothetical protein
VVFLFLQTLDSKEIWQEEENWKIWDWESELNKTKVVISLSHITTYLPGYLSSLIGEIEGWLSSPAFSIWHLFYTIFSFALGRWRFGRVQYQR